MRHCLLKKKQNSYDGCCWFWVISGGLCVFTYFSVCVCCSCCVSGDSHTGPLIENPFPRYSVINKGKDREFHRSKWPLVSDNRASLTLPPLTAAALQPTTPEWENDRTSHTETYFLMWTCGRSPVDHVDLCSWVTGGDYGIRFYFQVTFTGNETHLFFICSFLNRYILLKERPPVNSSPWFWVFWDLRLIFNAPSDFQSKKLQLYLTHETCQGLQWAGWVLALVLKSWNRKQNSRLLFQMFSEHFQWKPICIQLHPRNITPSLLLTQTDGDFAHNSSQGFTRYLRYALLHSTVQLLSNLLESKSPDSHCTIHHVSFQFIASGAAPGFISWWNPRLEACFCGF